MKGGEAKKKKKKKNFFFFFFFFFFCKIGNFLSGMGKNILFGIGNGAEFRPQNRVIESPVCKRMHMSFKSVCNKEHK